MSSSLKPLLPRNITVSTAVLGKIDNELKTLFGLIYTDYVKRFKVKPIPGKRHVAISGVEPNATCLEGHSGVTIIMEDRVLIQVEDPYMEFEDELPTHNFIAVKFIETLCHEMVHGVQAITEQKGRRRPRIPHNAKDGVEAYYFDPDEVEARYLESYYAAMFGGPLLIKKLTKPKDEK
jgi:hypothetical protein